MKIKGLKHWINKPYSKEYLTKGLQALKSVAIEFLFKNFENEQSNEENTGSKNPSQISTTAWSSNFGGFFGPDEADDTPNIESLQFSRDKALDEEIEFFSKLLADRNVIKNTMSTSKFWEHHRNKMPKLHDLQIILLNIPSSSAFIERYFSISGIVCDVRRLNMTEQMVIIRFYIKASGSLGRRGPTFSPLGNRQYL